MKKIYTLIYTLSATFLSLSTSFAADQTVDQRLIGTWQGMREDSGKCQFLSWKTKFTSDARFEITFFSDKEKTKKIQTESGTWKAINGKNELKTDGVTTPEIYNYSVLDENTIKYVNTVKDPSADCQEDYEFIERRVANTLSK